jgi:guanyl-specific ribonuclease Sa
LDYGLGAAFAGLANYIKFGTPTPSSEQIALAYPAKPPALVANASKPSDSIPENARNVSEEIKLKNGVTPQGYKGGKIYNNQPVNGGQKLPGGVNYKEYDIYPYVKGQNRGAERIVIGDNGTAWYTNDHYQSFIQIK